MTPDEAASDLVTRDFLLLMSLLRAASFSGPNGEPPGVGIVSQLGDAPANYPIAIVGGFSGAAPTSVKVLEAAPGQWQVRDITATTTWAWDAVNQLILVTPNHDTTNKILAILSI